MAFFVSEDDWRVIVGGPGLFNMRIGLYLETDLFMTVKNNVLLRVRLRHIWEVREGCFVVWGELLPQPGGSSLYPPESFYAHYSTSPEKGAHGWMVPMAWWTKRETAFAVPDLQRLLGFIPKERVVHHSSNECVDTSEWVLIGLGKLHGSTSGPDEMLVTPTLWGLYLGTDEKLHLVYSHRLEFGSRLMPHVAFSFTPPSPRA